MTETQVGVVTGSDIPGPNITLLSSMPRVDLMPPEVGEKDALRRLQLGCAAALVACAVAVGSLWFQAHSTVGDAKTDLAQTENAQRSVNRQVAALSSVSAQYAALENANKLVEQALGGEVRWSAQLRDLSMTIPANVWLTSMTIAGSSATATAASSASTASSTPTNTAASIATITFEGTASSRYDLATWLAKISTIKGYVGATYTTSTETIIGPAVYIKFTSTVQVTSDAQSGRYSKLAGS